MLTDLAFTVLEKSINSYLQLDPNVIHSLGQHIGKCLSIEITGAPGPLYVTVISEGIHLSRQAPLDISATIQGSLFTLFQLQTNSTQPPIGNSKVTISGDMHFAKSLREILSNINIDWEEYLARWVSDPMAHYACSTIRDAKTHLRKTVHHISEDITEFLQHEKQVTPTQTQADNFFNQVDELRDDVERLAQRVDTLHHHINKAT